MDTEKATAFASMSDMRAEFVGWCSDCGCAPDPKTADCAAAFAWLKLNPDEPETEH